MEYEHYLVKANQSDDPFVRLLYVSSFIGGQYSTTWNYRMMKPFNPVLGELYELKNEKFKYISESIHSNPPTQAVHAEAKDYKYAMDSFVKMGFNGTYMKATPCGIQHVWLNSRDEHYGGTRPLTHINNILWGTLHLETAGTLKCKNY